MSEEAPLAETADVTREVKKEKKVKKRKRQFYTSIREQMEFYFSDTNLSKDRFMSQLVAQVEDGFVDLEIFIRFNRIRRLTTSIAEIAQSLTTSTILRLDETKTKCRRVTPIKDNADADERTIYVEQLPKDVDHDWVKNVFRRFGNVSYVSLPKFNTGQPKGFAFVEFDSIEACLKSCAHFGTFYEGSRGSQPEVCSSPSEQARPSHKRKFESDDEADKDVDGDKPEKKRPVESKNEDVEEPVKKAKKRTIEEPVVETQVNNTDGAEPEPAAENAELTKKKKRKRHKKKAKDNMEDKTISLRVISKNEWKSLKNKYLALQKANMSRLKQSLLCMQAQQDNEQIPTNAVAEMQPDNQSSSQTKKTGEPEYVPNVIVKLELKRPVTDRAKFVEDVKNAASVSYVEAKEDDTTVYVRCCNAESAQQMLTANIRAIKVRESSLLTGDEEKAYWDKLRKSREKGHSDKSDKVKRRGKDKLTAKAEKMMEKSKHIYFDD